MIATWLLGLQSSVEEGSKYFNLMGVVRQGRDQVSPALHRVMAEFCVHQEREVTDHFDLSPVDNGVWHLLHWEVLLLLLAQVHPTSCLEGLCDLYPLTRVDISMIGRPALAFDRHCHLDQCRQDFELPGDASLQRICAQASPEKEFQVTLKELWTVSVIH